MWSVLIQRTLTAPDTLPPRHAYDGTSTRDVGHVTGYGTEVARRARAGFPVIQMKGDRQHC